MIRISTTSVALLFVAGHVAFAQPTTDVAPKTVNPTNVGPLPTEEQKQKMFAKMDELAKMTPEQRQAQMQNINHQLLRSMLSRSGFTDASLQETILSFVDDQEKSRADVRRAAAKLYLALEPHGVATDDRGMEILLEDYLGAVDEAKTEREIATKALDAKIGFNTKPRLRAALLLNGIIGDAAPVTNDIVLSGTMTIGALAQGGFIGGGR